MLSKRMIPLFFTMIGVVSCSESGKKDKKIDKYQESKMTIEQIEKKNPVRFLSVEGTDKHNLIGQTVVKGEVTSKATVAVYKDIVVKISFLSKTGVKLEEDEEVVYEELKPGTSISFKSKFFAPKGTGDVKMTISGAKVAP